MKDRKKSLRGNINTVSPYRGGKPSKKQKIEKKVFSKKVENNQYFNGDPPFKNFFDDPPLDVEYTFFQDFSFKNIDQVRQKI